MRDLPKSIIDEFNAQYDTSAEDQANQARGEFLLAFPSNGLPALTLDGYVIGTKKPTFCTYVEVKTKLWANIFGTTAPKFGIYFGRTKTDPSMRYRFTRKFGDDADTAFISVKKCLIELVADGAARHFAEVDANKLSQMFKAKILSLYFPELYLNICSGEDIEHLASELGLPEDIPRSEQQHLLLEAKFANGATRDWSNPKFMTFLYNTYLEPEKKRHLKPFRGRRPPKIDIDEMLENRRLIGEVSEKFALEWEKKRLLGSGFEELINAIEDRRNTPGCGYDFRSHSRPNEERYIEVKSVGRNFGINGYRFFLSSREHAISLSDGHKDKYYFYLVFYNEKSPVLVEAWKATDLYAISELGPDGYVVAFDREDLK
jgi:Domain of unknown function (DUF3883)